MNRWPHFSSSRRSLPQLVQKKDRSEKTLFMAKTNWIVLAGLWSIKYFLLQIPRYSKKVSMRKENKVQGNCKVLCFTSKRKKRSLCKNKKQWCFLNWNMITKINYLDWLGICENSSKRQKLVKVVLFWYPKMRE